MRKIFVLEFMTMDGVIQAPGDSKEDKAEGFNYGGWMGPFFSKDMVAGKEMEKQMNATAALLLGRKTYDIWTGFWPDNPQSWPQVNKITKYVVSKTLKNPTWENTEILRDVEAIKKMKKSQGPDLQVYGSADLVQTLMEHDLVDEFWLKTFPLTIGTGKKLFQKGTIPASFTMYDGKITPNGIVFTYYKRAGKVKTENI